MNMFRILLAVFALVATTFNLSAQGGPTTVVPNLLMTPVGTPTITSINITPAAGSSNTTYQVNATFNASLTAQNGDITIGLPAATLPLITNSSTSLSILKNGVADTSTVYPTTISFVQPSTGVVAGSGSTFVLQRNNSVTVPITVGIVVTNGGANTYAIRLASYTWSDSGGKSSSPLTGTSWTTPSISAGGGGGPTTPVTPVPDYIAALRSTADLSAYLAATARVIDIYVSATDQVGNTVNKRIPLTGPATTRVIDQTVRNTALQIGVLKETTTVYYQVDVHSADYRISLSANEGKQPTMTRGGLAVDFKLKLRFQGDVLMLEPNIQQATLKIVGPNGNIIDTRSLNISAGQGFYISPDAVASGFLEVIVSDGTPSGKTMTFDLRGGVIASSTNVTATAAVTKENVEYVLDKTEINLIPETVGGRGKNVLGEIELTKATTVSIAAMTTEGKKAVSFRYRQISPTFTAAWSTAPASNGTMAISLAIGDWQVIPVWDPRDLLEPIYNPRNN